MTPSIGLSIPSEYMRESIYFSINASAADFFEGLSAEGIT